jgi:hypothetical protein
MRTLFQLMVLLIASAAFLFGCERLVLTEGELDAKRHFASVEEGAAEHELMRRVGKPTVTFARSPDGTYKGDSVSADAQVLVRHLKGFDQPKVIAYLNGSVLAYYGINASGRVTRRVIEVS